MAKYYICFQNYEVHIMNESSNENEENNMPQQVRTIINFSKWSVMCKTCVGCLILPPFAELRAYCSAQLCHSVRHNYCLIDNWRTLGHTYLKLDMEVGNDQNTRFSDVEVIRSMSRCSSKQKACPINNWRTLGSSPLVWL